MTVVSGGVVAGTSMTVTTHAAGDLIFCFVRRANNTPATMPAAGGTVPTWTVIQAAGANTLALTSAWAVATATNHTTGVWTGASDIIVVVARADAGRRIVVGPSSTGNGATTQTIVYPALTLGTLAGTSVGVRCGTRAVADSEVANSPAGWSTQLVQPAAAGALMAMMTRGTLTANLIADSVATTGTNAAYRAHSFEVLESVPQLMAAII